MARTKKTKSKFELQKTSQGFQDSYGFHNKDQQTVIIRLSDLKLRLIQFNRNIIRANIFTPIPAIIAFWVPLFTSDFKGFFNFKPEEVRAAYFTIGAVLTILMLKNLIKLFLAKIKMKSIRFRLSAGESLAENRRRYETDPEKFAEYLCDDSEE